MAITNLCEFLHDRFLPGYSDDPWTPLEMGTDYESLQEHRILYQSSPGVVTPISIYLSQRIKTFRAYLFAGEYTSFPPPAISSGSDGITCSGSYNEGEWGIQPISSQESAFFSRNIVRVTRPDATPYLTTVNYVTLLGTLAETAPIILGETPPYDVPPGMTLDQLYPLTYVLTVTTTISTSRTSQLGLTLGYPDGSTLEFIGFTTGEFESRDFHDIVVFEEIYKFRSISELEMPSGGIANLVALGLLASLGMFGQSSHSPGRPRRKLT